MVVIEDVFISIVIFVLGMAVFAVVLRIAVVRARERKELARKQSVIASESELEEFIRRVDRVTAAEDLDHLGKRKEDS